MADKSRGSRRSASRRTYLAVLSGGLATGLAGCGGQTNSNGGGGNDTTTQGNPKLKKPVELYTWNLPFLKDSIHGWLKDFEKEYGGDFQNLDTKWTDKGPKTEDILSYFQSRLQSKNPPNIFDTQMSTFTRYAKDDVWVDLHQFAEKDFLDGYYDKLLEVFTQDGKLLQMPFYMGTSATFSRKKWFEQAGVKPPGTDRFFSTSEYLDMAEKVVKNSDAEFGLTFIRFDWQIWPWFWSEGIDIVNEDGSKVAFNTQQTHDLLSRFRQLTKDGVIPEVSWTGDWKPAAQQFGAGNTGMYFGSGSALRLVQNYGSDWVTKDSMAVGGSPKNKRYGGLLTMHGLGVVKPYTSDPSHRAAFDLIKVITDKKWQKDFLENTTVLVPNKAALKEMRNDDKFKSENPVLVELYGLWDNVSADVWVPPLSTASSQMAQIVDNQFSAAALGQKPVDEAIQTAEQRCNQALQS